MTHHSIKFDIDGMTCAGCAGRVEKALGAVTGVADAQVNLANETAWVTGDADLGALRDALDQAGYPAREAQVRFAIEGMHCASCVAKIEDALHAVPGVVSAQVNLANERADIRYLKETVEPQTLIARIADVGYTAHPEETDGTADRAAAEQAALRRDTLIAAALTMPVFLTVMGAHVVPSLHDAIMATLGRTFWWGAQFVLTTLVLIGPGRRFFRIGLPLLFKGSPDMNALVALGTLAAWGYSTVALFLPGLLPEGARDVYFEAAGVIVTLILLGRWLEARAKGQTGEAIRELMALRPETARVERNGEITEIAIDAVRKDDVLHLRPGERVAVDGEIVTGESYIDESMMTGEPEPVRKGPGDALTGGTVNTGSALSYRATAVGGDTVLSRIVAMVEEAQGAKLPIQALADRVVRVFVPIVLAIAAVTVAVWLLVGPDPALSLALVAGVSVLIISCPCAMGLATPTSIMVGTGRAAELGVLFRKGDALQMLDDVRIVAFDKTGTLTEGTPEVVRREAFGDWDADAVLRLVAGAEAGSEHPIARALERAAEGDLPDADTLESVAGHGLIAEVEGKRLLIGNARLMTREGVEGAAFDRVLDAFAKEGQTPVLVAIDGAPAAAFAVADPVKPEARAAIDALHAAGVEVAMITGDTRATAEAIGGALGIDRIEAEVLPDGKVTAVRALRDAVGPIAFVGDGINDAPALAEADVGIAIGTGTDIAVEAGDVVLASGRVSGVATARGVSAAVMRNIRQNLVWAFGYNVALIPVAAGVLYPLTGMLLSPMLAAGAMAASSVFVVTNALRLRRVQAEGTEA